MEGSVEQEADKSALFGILVRTIARVFHHHFSRKESELARLDQPDWAFRYFLDFTETNLEAFVTKILLWINESKNEQISSEQQVGGTGAEQEPIEASVHEQATGAEQAIEMLEGFLRELTRQTLQLFLRNNYQHFLETDALYLNLIKELGIL